MTPTLDSANYSSCSAASGHVELSDLNNFLTWMANAGQAGGAPAGAVLSTLSGAYGPVDTSAPTTTIACNAAPCAGTYSGVVSVTLAATDTGTGVSSTHYTLDGSDPTPASPTYTGAFNVNGTTVKFRSWDAQGNAEAVQTQVIQAPQDTAPPTTTISCNTAACGTDPYLNSVTIGLTPTDTGGSGVDKTYYTTNGSTPTTSSTVYSAPFQVTALGTTTVKFFSTDKAGNAEAVQSQQVTVVPATTRVALEFDNSSISVYSLGYQQALQPHGAKATFFVQSGSVLTNPAAGATQMSWAQLGTLAAAGNDIGGKSTSSANLTSDADPTTQVCGDRAAILSHGLTPVGFAYPGGANNATVQGIVKGCGYGNARGITSGTESLPPANWFATKANAPGTVTLASMQAAVNAAATNGGLVQLVISRVCDNTLDSANYTACSCRQRARRAERPQLLPRLDGQRRPGRRRSRWSSAQHTQRRVRTSRHVGSHDDHRVQRCGLREHALLRRRERDARRHRHGHRRVQHPLHPRRQRPDAGQPDVHGCLQRQRRQPLRRP